MRFSSIKEIPRIICSMFRYYDRNNSLLINSEMYLHNIFSYCQNEFLLKNDKRLFSSERYEYFKKIHNLLKVEELANDSLERVGNDGDGGYVMAYKKEGWRYSREKIAYSLGISTDVTWDKHMVGGVRGIPI